MSLKFTIILFVMLSTLVGSMSSEICSKLMITYDEETTEAPSLLTALTSPRKFFSNNGDEQTEPKAHFANFQCPRLFESRQREWCCESNTRSAHCCVWRERAKHMTWAEYQSMIIVVLLFAAAFLILFLFCLIVAIKLHEKSPHTRYASNCPYEDGQANSSAPNDDSNSPMLPNNANSEEPPSYEECLKSCSRKAEFLLDTPTETAETVVSVQQPQQQQTQQQESSNNRSENADIV